MYKRVERTKKRKRILFSAQSLSPQSWRGARLAVLGSGAGSGTAAALTAPLLPSSAANCLLRGSTLGAPSSPWGGQAQLKHQPTASHSFSPLHPQAMGSY